VARPAGTVRPGPWICPDHPRTAHLGDADAASGQSV